MSAPHSQSNDAPMTATEVAFAKWWYDYRIKNNISDRSIHRDIAFDAWKAALSERATLQAAVLPLQPQPASETKGTTSPCVVVPLAWLEQAVDWLGEGVPPNLYNSLADIIRNAPTPKGDDK